MQSFAETFVSYPDAQQNVNAPPDSVLLNGFIPETAGARGQPLAAQWLNYLFRTLFRYVNRDKVTGASGTGLFPYPDCSIRIEAIDMADTNKYLIAIGYKGAAGTLHSLKVTSSATLTLGTPTTNGDQPILGGANVRVTGYSRQIGDL